MMAARIGDADPPLTNGTRVRHLIIGGSGFVGAAIAHELCLQGETVAIGSRSRPPPATSQQYSAQPQWIPLDVQTVDWDQLLASVDIIHHYAWSSVPNSAAADPIRDISDHLPPLVRLLQSASRLGGKRIVFISSGGTVYGKQKGEFASESDLPQPVTIYGATKLAAEGYLRVFHETQQVDCRVGRLANPYGAGQNIEKQQGLVTTFLRRAVNNETLHIWGDGSVVRDYIHVSDAINGLLLLSKLELKDKKALPIINIGTGVGYSVNEVVDQIAKLIDHPISVIRHPSRPVDVDRNVLAVNLAADLLGWAPKVDLSEGMSLTLKAWSRSD